MSRVMSGEQADLPDESFVAILKVFSGDLQAQAELVAARCMDVRVGPGSEQVEISIKGAGRADKRDAGPVEVHLSEETERAFAWLRSQCLVNADLEKHLIGYARLTGMK
jgi:hypothetical protein